MATKLRPISLTTVLRSEWLKLRTLRSSWAILTGSIVAMIVFGLILAFNTRHVTQSQDAEDLTRSAVMQGFYIVQLLLGAFGVIFVSSEFNTGQIRSTFSAVPKRLYVLMSKLLLLAVLIITIMSLTCVVTFILSQALIGHYRPGFSILDMTSLRVVFGTALYLTIISLIGSAIGWLVRNTPAALVTFIALLLVFPVVFELALGNFGKSVAKFFPSGAGGAFIMIPPEPKSLSPWAGLIVLIVWVATLLTIAAITLARRDV